MANLTLALEDDLLQQARLRALQQGTSVNALLRDYLQAFTGARRGRETAVRDLLDLSAQAESRRADQRWTREELHER